MIVRLVLVTLLLFSLNAFCVDFGSHSISSLNENAIEEQSCTPSVVDTSHFPESVDQQDLNWCHAFAFASLMSFYAKQKISPYAIAMEAYAPLYAKATSRPPFADWAYDPAGDFAVIMLSHQALCLESNFSKPEGGWPQLSEAIYKLNDDVRVMKNQFCTKSFWNFTSGIDLKTVESLQPFTGIDLTQIVLSNRCKQNVQTPQGFMKGIFSMGSSECPDPDQKSICKIIPNTELATPSTLKQKIDQEISSKQPIIISYNGKFLLNEKYSKDAPVQRGGHYSLLVGRRFNRQTGQCEYRLKNSWSETCAGYKEKYQETCENGMAWIPAKDLLPDIEGVQWFEPNRPK